MDSLILVSGRREKSLDYISRFHLKTRSTYAWMKSALSGYGCFTYPMHLSCVRYINIMP